MSEKFLSKKEERSASDTELIREGASLIYDGKNDQPRIEVTEEQIEQARNEMGKYLAIVKKEKEIDLKASIEVEKMFIDFMLAVKNKDTKKINRSVADLLVMIKETQGDLSPDSNIDMLEMTRRGYFDASKMLRRLSKWIDESQIPVIGMEDKNPTLLKISDILTDNDNVFALKVRTVLKRMSDPTGCLQVKYPDGKIDCPNCSRAPRGY